MSMNLRGPSEQYVLNVDQREKLMAVCEDVRDRVIVKLPMFLGLRAGEAIHVRTAWVDSEHNLRIPPEMRCTCETCGKRKTPGVWAPKTARGARTIAIPQYVKDDLGPFLASYPAGLNMSRFAFHHRIKLLMGRARITIPGLGGDTGFPHILRATCATMLAEGGMSAMYLCYAMGWKDLQQGQHYVNQAVMKSGATEKAKQIFGG